MKKRQVLILIFVAAVLGFLVYLQVQHWRKFDWEEFADQVEYLQWGKVAIGVLLIYVADALRAARWAIFLRPVRKVRARELVGTQFIGFAGLGLLGRPGEFIRPYLIARKLNLSFSSQLAVWTVERIFDIGSVTVIIAFAMLSSILSAGIEKPTKYEKLGALALIVILIIVIVLAYLVRRYGTRIARIAEKVFQRFPSLGHRLAGRIVAFSEGLNTLQGLPSFLASTAVSLLIWILVSASYVLITRAYPSLRHLPWQYAVLLMGFSVVGGVLQLPLIGGGSQFMTITALTRFYGVPSEVGVSCGILLWLATFMSVIPLGLIYAHFEHVSFRQLSRESQKTEESLAS
jgi:uncharacterized protein (TIRG00374 family)